MPSKPSANLNAMPYKPKANAPALGDNLEAGTLFPVQLPMRDRRYLKTLKPEQYEQLLALREKILRQTGVRDIGELANRSYDKEFVGEISRRVLLNRDSLGETLSPGTREEEVGRLRKGFRVALDSLFPGRKRQREEKLMERRMGDAGKYGRKVDKLVKNIVSKLFPGYTKALGQRNEIMATHNPGKLLLMAADESRNNKIRYEAKRKLSLMEHAAKVDKAIEKRKQHLEFLADLMDERVFDPNGEKRGGTKPQWMVSAHNPNDGNRCVGQPEFLDEPPAELRADELIEQIDFRTIEVPQKDGSVKKIDFMFDLNAKDDESIWLKSLRHPERSLDDFLRDLNRGRFLFKDEDEMEQAMAEMEERIRGAGYEVTIDKRRNGVGGDKKNPAIPCTKFNLVINGRDYELQAFTPQSYVDYFCWKPYAWCMHEVNRFFDNSLSETFFPEAHYPGLDREAMAEQAREREYESVLAARRILPARRSIKAQEARVALGHLEIKTPELSEEANPLAHPEALQETADAPPLAN